MHKRSESILETALEPLLALGNCFLWAGLPRSALHVRASAKSCSWLLGSCNSMNAQKVDMHADCIGHRF